MEEKPKVTIWSDGACKGAGGIGGYGSILLWNNKRLDLCEAFRSTTNNRMELMGAIAGLEALTVPCDVVVNSDSRYLVDTVTFNYFASWQRKGWKTSSGSHVKNIDLWERLLDQLKIHSAKFVWVKGHAGVELNEAADRLANLAIKFTETFSHDHPYEAECRATKADYKPQANVKYEYLTPLVFKVAKTRKPRAKDFRYKL